MAELYTDIERLRPGVFVSLDLPWLDHPFLTNSFKIRNEKQLAALRALGLPRIRYDPDRSDALPLADDETQEVPTATIESASDQLWAEKKARIERLKQRRTRIQQCENNYRQSVGLVKQVMQNLLASSELAAEATETLVKDMVTKLTADRDVAVHLVNYKDEKESSYYHVMNVAVLAALLGKSMGLNADRLALLTKGALFHDIGKSRIPGKVLRKQEPWTAAERQLYEMHPAYGVSAAKNMGYLPREVVIVIAQHHECWDGSGFPQGLKGPAISELADIVHIADTYDSLCNPVTPARTLTPYEAVSRMFSRQRSKFRERPLQLFISLMGVFPPGTLVRLSGDRIGMVISVNRKNLLRPNVLLYSDSIPKEEALIIDLVEESDLEIVETLKPATVPIEVFDYLNPGEQVNYYFTHTQPARQR